MGRPRTSYTIKDGFYIEVSSKNSANGIKIGRETKEEIDRVIEKYENIKEVNYLGEVRDGKFIN